MQNSGVIKPSESPWASPIVLVRKKDGSIRLCVDYRALNSVTKADSFPLPRIDDILDRLGESRYFTTLDLKSGYWQVKVHPSSCEKTAFITNEGLYEFRVMPFGLMNAPTVFQRLMRRVLEGVDSSKQFVSVYLDDVLIYSKAIEEHLVHLSQVLSRMKEVGLKLNPKKYHFTCNQVTYLGHTITPSGLKPNSDHLMAVENFPVPKDIKSLKQFLGLSSFYRRFVRNFAKIAEPLHRLTRKDIPFVWSPDCQQSYEYLKSKLIESPVLAYPNFNEDFCLETDASVKGLGAILSQVGRTGRNTQWHMQVVPFQTLKEGMQ